jgi:acetate kinase
VPDQDTTRILTINSGSSSLKVALYEMSQVETLLLTANVERVGLPDSQIQIIAADGAPLFDQHNDLPNHDAALQALFTWLKDHPSGSNLSAVGHRVVHGGSRYSEPQPVTPTLIAALRELTPVDPDHLPQALDGIETVGRIYPSLPQVACFDTAFHRHMPKVAQMYALPRKFYDAGLLRYGFHGLSYEFILWELRHLDPVTASGRVIIAHLGNGASMVAVQAGLSLDTTMGFTPVAGLVMGTRCGDLDPGALLYLQQAHGMTAAELNELINQQSGLLGISETSSDMKDLLDREAEDPRAAEAIALFCYQAKKYLGAYTAALGGLDTLVFTGGIGEHAAAIRRSICDGLSFLGLQLDPERNDAHAPLISGDNSRVTVRVIKTDEDLMIARHTHDLIISKGAKHVSI